MSKQASNKKSAADKHQQTSAFLFLPFVVDVFSRRDLRIKRADMMPMGRAEYLTAEVVDALSQVISRGTLGFMCRQGGWRSIDWARPGEEEPVRDARLTDRRVWSDLKLRFGDEAIDGLMIAYNAVCHAGGTTVPTTNTKGKQSMYPRSKHMAFGRNGDMLAHHVAFLKVRQAAFKVDNHYWQYLTRNPLTALCRLDARKNPEKVTDRLSKSDMDTVLPWLWGHVASCWQRELETRWDTLERFHRLNEGMETYFTALVERARTKERRDLLVPLLIFFKAHLDREDAEDVALNEFNRLARDLRFADRDTYMRTWGRAMHVGWELYEEYMEARSIHPVDREAPDRVYMGEFEAMEFEPVAYRARALSNQLNAVIS